AGRTRLVRVDLRDGQITPLYDPERLNQIAFPTVSRDGRTIIASRVSDTLGRDLIAVDVATGLVKRVEETDDPAMELHARFSLDGDWLLYASDRTGIFDLYARRWPDGPTYRATRVVTGALSPALSPDGRTLAMSVITSDGFDLADTPFNPAALLPLPPAADPPAPLRATLSDAPLPTPSRPYAPSETLWPVGWTPSFAFSSATESASVLGVEVDAGDPIGRHYFLAAFETQPEEESLSAALTWVYRRFVPTFVLNLTHSTRTRENGALWGAARTPWRERVTVGSASVSLPFSQAARGASASLSYTLAFTRPAENEDPTYDPLDPAPRLPDPSRNGVLSLSLGYSDVESHNYNAVSLEEGRSISLSLRLRHPVLASELTTAEIFWGWSEYFRPWLRHVLALRLNGAFGRGEVGRRAFFSLAAPPDDRNLLLDALDDIRFGNGALRGYPTGTVFGDRFVLASLEYRLPLFDISSGFSTLPLFLQRLKLAVFSDWAQADFKPLDWEPSAFHRSIGAEIVTEATIAWKKAVSARVGYAHGLDDDGEGQTYLFLGGWF
ncbi:MAG: PD40 domain-containing protein, partial [Myxococcales bacterium]|nr:PD40 domain-containing protein [Myxococcales bacterium]